MVWPAVITAGASLLGGLISAKGAEKSAAMTPELMERQAAINRGQFEYELRQGPSLEMAGLKAAGINPMLRYGSGGSGVSAHVPGVQIPSQPPNQWADLGAGIAGAGSSAYSALSQEQGIAESRQRVENYRGELERIQAEIPRINADTRLTEQQRVNAMAEQGRILQQTALGAAEEYLRYAQANLSDSQAAQANAMVRLLGQQFSTEEYRTMAERYMVYVRAAEADIRTSEATRAEIDESIYSGPLGRWLRETLLMREATGASGLLGVGQAAVNSAIEGIQQLFE